MFEHTVINGVKYTAFSCLKACEGGISQSTAIFLLDQAGIKTHSGCYSPYIGHYGLWVELGKRKERKAEKVLFGS